MFKLEPAPTFALKVLIHVPGADAPAALQLTARHRGRAALKAWLERTQAGAKADADLLLEVIEGWAGVTDAADTPLELSRDNLAQLLDAYHGAGKAILDAYVVELTEGRRKN